MIRFHGQFKESRFAWELCMFHKLRDWSDGMSFFEFKVNCDRYVGDHTPKFEVFFVLLNFTILDFSVYNIYHVEHARYNKD